MGNQVITHTVTVGDTNTAIAAVLRQSGRAVDTNGKTVEFYAVDTSDESVTINYATATTASTTAFTANKDTNAFTANNHQLEKGDEVKLTTTGTLPSDGKVGGALNTTDIYWVVGASDNTFKLGTVKNGTPIDVIDAGIGVHSFRPLGKVTYSLTTDDVAEANAGTHMAAFRITSGGKYDHFPNDQTIAAPKFKLVINSVTT